ncbi:MAG: PfaD family polyunsaturated fatty acid/polyketide biosynthesis protein [Candidatus Sericytochromatia bacterium]|nr:PfaD family polyunsaturated fatty acid/polyketide biosynthesis protein [Candidatus Sericytochromatia bacterium]
MITTDPPVAAAWLPPMDSPRFQPSAIADAVARIREPLHVVRDLAAGGVGVAFGAEHGQPPAGVTWLGTLPPLWPEWLGDRAFTEAHGVRFPYVGGEMANGIASVEMVVALARAGMLGFFGAAGLSPARIEASLGELVAALGRGDAPGSLPWGANLIHSLHEPALEERTVDLFLQHGVTRVSASAFMALTPAIVRYAFTGVRVDAAGRVHRRNHVFAKISRPETARAFMSPPPAALLQALVQRGALTAEEAALAADLPVAEDLTAESDSGGHTDNRPLGALFSTIRSLGDAIAAERRYARPLRVGAAGGLGTPAAVAAAFAQGAAYVMTGSVNQSAVEAGQSEAARQMLALADLADVVMCPAGDMFELGVKVQVLKKGTMFAARAQRLYELYVAHDGLASLAPEVRSRLEKDVFQGTLDDVWAECVRYFTVRDPLQLTRAERDAKHQMALVFRWYLGQSSRWAIAGVPERRLDYQIWCGPAMGAFNAWVKGTFLEAPEARGVVQIGLNLLEGAAIVTRAHQLRTYGAPVPASAFDFRPRPLALA